MIFDMRNGQIVRNRNSYDTSILVAAIRCEKVVVKISTPPHYSESG